MKVARDTTTDYPPAGWRVSRRGCFLLLSMLAMAWLAMAFSPASSWSAAAPASQANGSVLAPETGPTIQPQALSSTGLPALQDCGEGRQGHGAYPGFSFVSYCPPAAGTVAAGAWQPLQPLSFAAFFPHRADDALRPAVVESPFRPPNAARA